MYMKACNQSCVAAFCVGERKVFENRAVVVIYSALILPFLNFRKIRLSVV